MIGRHFNLSDEADAWVARMDAQQWTAASEAELQRWLAKDSRAAGALLRSQAAWASLDISASQQEIVRPNISFANRRNLLVAGTALAASLVLAMVLPKGGDSYETDIGEIRRVPLADGSIASINTGSRLDVHLAPTQREVRLDRGEAWFHVAKDKQRPFIVEAGSVRVMAVGTAFSVRQRTGGADILVTEGVVETWVNGAEGHKVRLHAGQSAFVATNAAINLSNDAPSAVDRALAWRGGKIDLTGQRLDQAIAEFNRYNRRQIVLQDPTLAAEKFDGVFQTDDVEGFAAAIRESLGVPVDLTAARQIVIGQK